MKLIKLVITETENDGVIVERFSRQDWEPEDIEWIPDIEIDESFERVHRLLHKARKKVRADISKNK